MMDEIERKELAVEKFRDYLRIESVHPDPDYEPIIKFLNEYAADLHIDCRNVEVGEDKKVVVVMTIPGKDPSLPSLMLNSHTDVVPVFPEQWKHDPFAAIKEENGDIYARGAQDMKCVGIQYLEAIRILKLQKKMQFLRTIYLTFMPDEETGGFKGMQCFIQSPEFKSMNIGFALDEGLAHPENKYSVFYGERGTWWVRIKCEGSPGDGSRFIQNTAVEKLLNVTKKFMDFRKEEESRLQDTCVMLGDVTTVNLTMLEGGVQLDVVPNEFAATFDIRIPPSADLEKFEKTIEHWCNEAGPGVSYEFLCKATHKSITSTDDDNVWWNTFIETLKLRGVDIVKEIFPAGTDSTYLREAGYPAIGFSPMRNTPILLHDHNEFLNEEIFLEGIDVYCDLISALADVVES